MPTPNKILMGIYFYPRGGSAHVCRATAREFERNDFEVTVLLGSRSDLGEHALARCFYAGLDLRTVDFTPALRSPDTLRFSGPAETAPMHGSYEDRPDAEDPILASLDDDAYELQVDAWMRELHSAGAAEADLLYLHHLTPLNEAAARAFPEIPVFGHIHGTELLMLERIMAGAPPEWRHAEIRAERICDWATACERIVVSNQQGLKRAAAALDLDPERFVCAPTASTRTLPLAKSPPRPLAPPSGREPAGMEAWISARQRLLKESSLEALEGVVLLYVGRFTEVKRLPLLIEAFARARPRFDEPAALVLVGGHAGEWEGEHPLDAIERLGCPGVFLAGWHSQTICRTFCAPATFSFTPRSTSSSARCWSRRWPASCR